MVNFINEYYQQRELDHTTKECHEPDSIELPVTCQINNTENSLRNGQCKKCIVFYTKAHDKQDNRQQDMGCDQFER